MNRKSIGKKSVATALSGMALVAVLSSHAFDSQTAGSCVENNSPNNTTSVSLSGCQSFMAEAVSWFDWVGGKSRSHQFHFLDLLELLYSNDDDDGDTFQHSPTSSL